MFAQLKLQSAQHYLSTLSKRDSSSCSATNKTKQKHSPFFFLHSHSGRTHPCQAHKITCIPSKHTGPSNVSPHDVYPQNDLSQLPVTCKRLEMLMFWGLAIMWHHVKCQESVRLRPVRDRQCGDTESHGCLRPRLQRAHVWLFFLNWKPILIIPGICRHIQTV